MSTLQPGAASTTASSSTSPPPAYQVALGYVGSDNATSPFLFSPAAPPPAPNTFPDIVVSFPYVRATAATPQCSNTAFTLSYPSSTAVQITAAGKYAWTASPPNRSALRGYFVDFCEQLEASEIQGALVPGATAYIARQLGESLPRAFNEALFYSYGLNPEFDSTTTPYVNLLPGMRLRLETAARQFVSPGSPFNAFVPAARLEYDIVRYVDGTGKLCTGFDAFLSAISMPTVPLTAGGQASVAGGVADLQPSGRRHYRLVYPSTYYAASAAGNVALGSNVAIIGTDTLQDLETATTAYRKTGTCGPATGNKASIECTIFSGRTIAVPEIPVTLAFTGSLPAPAPQVLYVPVGTTVRHLLERFATWHPNVETYGSYNHFTNVNFTLQRFWWDQTTLPAFVSVQPPTSPAGGNNGTNTALFALLDLPLANGDCLTLTRPGPPAPKS